MAQVGRSCARSGYSALTAIVCRQCNGRDRVLGKDGVGSSILLGSAAIRLKYLFSHLCLSRGQLPSMTMPIDKKGALTPPSYGNVIMRLGELGASRETRFNERIGVSMQPARQRRKRPFGRASRFSRRYGSDNSGHRSTRRASALYVRRSLVWSAHSRTAPQR
jgi:hypothetical protein